MELFQRVARTPTLGFRQNIRLKSSVKRNSNVEWNYFNGRQRSANKCMITGSLLKRQLPDKDVENITSIPNLNYVKYHVRPREHSNGKGTSTILKNSCFTETA